jgi:hypothetical protein
MTAEEVRMAMGPEFCGLADELRERFGAKLVWLKSGALEIGKDPTIGSVNANGKLDDEIERMRYWYGKTG